jgi:hypothetical protein
LYAFGIKRRRGDHEEYQARGETNLHQVVVGAAHRQQGTTTEHVTAADEQ